VFLLRWLEVGFLGHTPLKKGWVGGRVGSCWGVGWVRPMKTCIWAAARQEAMTHCPDRRRTEVPLTITAEQRALRRDIGGRDGEKGALGSISLIDLIKF
jgi:hypothetical protein